MEVNKKYCRTTAAQFWCYVQFCIEHPEFLAGKNSPESPQRMEELWQRLTGHLNSMVGPNKTANNWKDSLRNWRKQLTHRARKQHVEMRRTGGGPYGGSLLSEFEEQALDVFGRDSITGHTGRAMGFCTTEFEIEAQIGQLLHSGSSTTVDVPLPVQPSPPPQQWLQPPVQPSPPPQQSPPPPQQWVRPPQQSPPTPEQSPPPPQQWLRPPQQSPPPPQQSPPTPQQSPPPPQQSPPPPQQSPPTPQQSPPPLQNVRRNRRNRSHRSDLMAMVLEEGRRRKEEHDEIVQLMKEGNNENRRMTEALLSLAAATAELVKLQAEALRRE